MSAGNPFERGYTATRLYRDPSRGKILGVCAGLADYFGVHPTLVRVAAVFALLLFSLPTLAAYFVAGALLEKRPPRLYETGDEERFFRDVRADPARCLRAHRQRMRELDRRLAAMERYVTSPRFDLNRRFRDLGA